MHIRTLLATAFTALSLVTVTGCAVNERLVPSIAAATLAIERGAHVLRVHDVAATVQAVKVWQAAFATIA